MRQVVIYNPGKLHFGPGVIKRFQEEYLTTGLSRLFIITLPAVLEQVTPVLNILKEKGKSIALFTELKTEPTFDDFHLALEKAREFKADSIVGIGGGSTMDLAKLLAAFLTSSQPVDEAVGNGLVAERKAYLACIPTTSGTGSEVSPNAILLDRTDGNKKGIISPLLVPDAAYVDPELTLALPPAVTAFTGIDALTHCIEAYTNKFAHPLIDTFALEGIRLITGSLHQAVTDGENVQARSDVSLGSLYGGMCLGPVNTAAVHALAYPLGSIYKMPHGLSNAKLLPFVMEYNMSEAPEKYAEISRAMGENDELSDYESAERGIQNIKELIEACGISLHLESDGISPEKVPDMAESAMKVQRLLKNNIKEVDLEGAVNIYKKAF